MVLRVMKIICVIELHYFVEVYFMLCDSMIDEWLSVICSTINYFACHRQAEVLLLRAPDKLKCCFH
jgi:hypothetical protein